MDDIVDEHRLVDDGLSIDEAKRELLNLHHVRWPRISLHSGHQQENGNKHTVSGPGRGGSEKVSRSPTTQSTQQQLNHISIRASVVA